MAARRCTTPGCRALVRSGGRCASCRQRHDQERNASRPWYGSEWRKLRSEVLTAWRAEHGDWCPGVPELDHPAHPAADLTVDHITPRSLDGGVRVMCRKANSTLGAQHQHAQ